MKKASSSVLSQREILGFPKREVVEGLLEFMIGAASNQDKNKLESAIKTWLIEAHNAAYEKVLFIDFALCQIKNASTKYFFINGGDSALEDVYKKIIKNIVKRGSGVAVNFGFTSGEEIHDDQDYPYFSGLYCCSDAGNPDGHIPVCLKVYAGKLRDIAPEYGLKSWCAIPVNTPSQTGIYNLAQIFIGFKTTIEVESDAAVKAMIKDLISIIHYLSHWLSSDVKVIEELFSLGSTQDKRTQNAGVSPQTARDDKSYFRERLTLFLGQFKNLLLARIVLMPSVNSDSKLVHSYNFSFARFATPAKRRKTRDLLMQEVLDVFDEDRAKTSGFSISKKTQSNVSPLTDKTRKFHTNLIPSPGKGLSKEAPRKQDHVADAAWAARWRQWCRTRNSSGGNNATMVFIPITRAGQDNESYVYAEFLGKKEDIKRQIKTFKESVSSVIDNTIIFLQLYEENQKRLEQMEQLFADLMRSTRDVDVFARLFALGFNAYDDMKDFRENFGFISYYVLDASYKSLSFVLVPQDELPQSGQDRKYLYSNYAVKDYEDDKETIKNYFEKFGSSLQRGKSTADCLDALSRAWESFPVQAASQTGAAAVSEEGRKSNFEGVLFYDINESDKSEKDSDCSHRYKKAIAAIINGHSISRSIIDSPSDTQSSWRSMDFSIKIKNAQGKPEDIAYTAYYRCTEQCAVIVFFTGGKPEIIISLGMKNSSSNLDPGFETIINGLWKHQLQYLVRAIQKQKQNMSEIEKLRTVFEELPRGKDSNWAHADGNCWNLVKQLFTPTMIPQIFFEKCKPSYADFKALSGPYPEDAKWYFAHNLAREMDVDSNYHIQILLLWMIIQNNKYDYLNFAQLEERYQSLSLTLPCHSGYKFLCALLDFLHTIDSECSTYTPINGKVEICFNYDETDETANIQLLGLRNPLNLLKSPRGAGCSKMREKLRFCAEENIPCVAFSVKATNPPAFVISWISEKESEE